MSPRMFPAALTLAAVAIPIGISVPDWQPWQMLLGALAVGLAIASIAISIRQERPYRLLVAEDDWQPTDDGGHFFDIPAGLHRKVYPTYAVFARRPDGGRDNVVTAGDVQTDGTVRLEIISRSEYEGEIR